MKKYLKTFGLLFFVVLLNNCTESETMSKNAAKPRIVVTTDGEVDDMDSFIRLLLYTNEFDVEGLIYSSSQWHYSGDGKGTLFTSEMPSTAQRYGARTDLRWPGSEWMENFISKYAQVYDKLIQHDEAYPDPEYLKSVVKVGNIEFEGEMSKDTEGSEWIKSILLDEEPGPVYVQIWGGTNTLARALKSIEDSYKNSPEWEEVYQKVAEKTVIYAILDQDATYTKYVALNWPDIKVIYNSAQFWSFAYMWPMVVPNELKTLMNGTWFAENIKFNHGPLLESYYLWGDGQKIEGDPEHTQGDSSQFVNRGPQQGPGEGPGPGMGEGPGPGMGEGPGPGMGEGPGPGMGGRPGSGEGDGPRPGMGGVPGPGMGEGRRQEGGGGPRQNQFDFISEGDTPAYLYLLDFGLRSNEDPSYGGLGGRFVQSATNPNRWEDGDQVTDYNPYTGKQETSYPQIRWIETTQNDFAARADWCVMDYDEANHAPVVILDQKADIQAKAGQTLSLKGSATDPDGDQVKYSWWQYVEAGTCQGEAVLEGADQSTVQVTLPADANAGETIHIILEVSDSGTPSLTRYQRVILTVK